MKSARQCWECHKRRLVCDHTLPHCKKCQKAGKECPGYDEQKPLQWVEPGKVTSKQRKNAGPSKVYVVPLTAHEDTSSGESQDRSSSPIAPPANNAICDKFDVQLDFAASEPTTDAWWVRWAEDHEEKIHWEGALQNMKGVQLLGEMSQRGDRRQIERIVRYGLRKEASEIMRTERDPLKKLEGLLWHMQIHDLPTYDYASNETSDVVQAVNYFNIRLLPEAKAAAELAPNPALMLIPFQALHFLPPAIHHTFACLALNHFVLTAPPGVDRTVVTSNRSKVYRHRGLAIRALSESIAKDKTRCSDLTIVSILMFMSMELSNPTATNWRAHARGLERLIGMRGGIKSLLLSGPHLSPSIVIYVLITTFANTCSPPWDQLEMNTNDSLEEYISDITPIYSLIFPYILCPPTLFFDLIRINHLRNLGSKSLLLCINDPNQTLEAQALLACIEAFDPEDWAQPGTYYDEWKLIGMIYQSAIAIYCTMSLQSLAILPDNLEMNTMRSIHGDRLRTSLTTAIKSKRLSRFIMWPLVVAGVEAGNRTEGVKKWVAQRLSNMSHELGTSSPLNARDLLMRYWEKGQYGWDECFDRSETNFVAAGVVI